jgi:hypothetical protein
MRVFWIDGLVEERGNETVPIGNSKKELKIHEESDIMTFRPARQFWVDGIKYSYRKTVDGNSPGTACVQPMFFLKDD